MSRSALFLSAIIALVLISFKTPAPVKRVNEIIHYIDKLYELTMIPKTDSLSEFSRFHRDTLAHENNAYGILNYVPSDLKRYYHHLSFDFFVFKDKSKANQMFSELSRLAANRPSLETPEGKKYMNLFSKGGTSFILYENMIIEHSRRCNYNEKIEKPRETKLLNYLFDDNLPASSHFIRVSCGWCNPEIN